MTDLPIVVGVDSTAEMIDAVRWAISASRDTGPGVVLAHAPDRADADIAGAAGLTVEQVAGVIASLYGSMAARIDPQTPVRTSVLDDEPAAALIQASRDASMVVLGSRGTAGFTESALGSVAHRVAVHAKCPVLIVPPHTGTRPPTGKVVVGVADEPAARAAARFAARVADRTDSTLVLIAAAVQADDPPPISFLTEQLAELAAQHAQLDMQAVIARTDAVNALTHAGQSADLLVLGCHHTSEQFNARLGPIPAAVLSQVSCPVALIGHIHDERSAGKP